MKLLKICLNSLLLIFMLFVFGCDSDNDSDTDARLRIYNRCSSAITVSVGSLNYGTIAEDEITDWKTISVDERLWVNVNGTDVTWIEAERSGDFQLEIRHETNADFWDITEF